TRDAQPLAPLADRLAHALEVELLQIAQAAVKRAEAVAAGRVPEVFGFDERDAQATASRFPGRAGAVNAAADHDDVMLYARHAFQVPVHTSTCGMPARCA